MVEYVFKSSCDKNNSEKWNTWFLFKEGIGRNKSSKEA